MAEELPDQMSVDALLKFVSTEDPDILVGERFLCKGSAFIVSGQSGIGKSSFGLQMLMCWCVGRDFFGIRAVRPLRIMIIQSENDLGDMAEPFQGIVKGLKFNPAVFELIKKDFIVHRDSSHTGEEFLAMLHTLIAKHRPDIVMIDPLLAVVGDDICEARVIGRFFRQGLNALMQVTGVVVVFMHHVPKPPKEKADQTNKDLSYSGSGSSDLTNWPRAIGVLQKLGSLDAYQFIVAKREKRTGMVNELGDWTDAIELQHGAAGIFWERMDKGLREEWEIEKAKTGKPGRKGYSFKHDESRHNTVVKWLGENPEASQTMLIEQLMRLYGGSDKSVEKHVLKTFLDCGFIKEPITGAKNGTKTLRFIAQPDHP
jgi:hypothetical protein